jgi:cytochrome c1
VSGRPPAVALAVALAAACGDETPGARRVPDAEPERGRAVVAAIGCGACHDIPGVSGANGIVGPSLDGFGRRALIAGVVANEPATLARWVSDAPSIAPRTAMPALPIDETAARDVAAFLYTLR